MNAETHNFDEELDLMIDFLTLYSSKRIKTFEDHEVERNEETFKRLTLLEAYKQKLKIAQLEEKNSLEEKKILRAIRFIEQVTSSNNRANDFLPKLKDETIKEIKQLQKHIDDVKTGFKKLWMTEKLINSLLDTGKITEERLQKEMESDSLRLDKFLDDPDEIKEKIEGMKRKINQIEDLE